MKKTRYDIDDLFNPDIPIENVVRRMIVDELHRLEYGMTKAEWEDQVLYGTGGPPPQGIIRREDD